MRQRVLGSIEQQCVNGTEEQVGRWLPSLAAGGQLQDLWILGHLRRQRCVQRRLPLAELGKVAKVALEVVEVVE